MEELNELTKIVQQYIYIKLVEIIKKQYTITNSHVGRTTITFIYTYIENEKEYKYTLDIIFDDEQVRINIWDNNIMYNHNYSKAIGVTYEICNPQFPNNLINELTLRLTRTDC